MATGNAIRAGRAFVELFADSTKLNAALKTVQLKFKAFGMMVAGWGRSLSFAGGAILAPILAVSKMAASAGDDLVNMSTRTGLSVEALSSLSHAAKTSGTNIEELEGGVRKMQKTIFDAAGGSKEAADALADLGLSAADLVSLSAEDQLNAVADAISKIDEPGKRAAITMEVMGKGATKLIPLLKDGSAGLREFYKQAEAMGLIISTKAAKEAADFNNQLGTLYDTIKRLGFEIASVLIPPLAAAAKWVQENVTAAIKWIGTHKEAVIGVTLIGIALVGAGVAMYVFGTAIVWAVGVLTAMQTILAGVWTVLGALGGSIATVVTSPLLATIAVLIAAGATFLWYSGEAGRAVNFLGERFGELRDFSKSAFQGIADALIAGDIKLAADILWTTLRIAWTKGINTLSSLWMDFKWQLLNVWSSIQTTLVKGWINTIAGLQSAWATFTSWYKMAVEGLANIIAVNLMGADQDYVDQQSQANISAIEKERDAALAAIEAERKARVGMQEGDQQRELEDAANANDKKKKENQEELNRLYKEFNDQLGKARQERNFRETQLGPGSSAPGIPDPSEIEAAVKNRPHFGTFSAAAAAAAGAIGGGSALENAAKETAKNTKELVRGVDDVRGAIENIGLTFA